MNKKKIARSIPSFKQVMGIIMLIGFIGFLGYKLEGFVGQQQDEWPIRIFIYTVIIGIVFVVRRVLRY